MRTVIVGAVHGCLEDLLALVGPCGDPSGTRYVMVGDLVAKGPDSRGVVEWARASNVEAVLGNHDAAVLHARNPAADPKPRPQHVDLAATLGADNLNWLDGLPFWIALEGDEAPSHLVVHGGLVPGVPLEAQERKYMLNMRSITDDGKPTKKIEGRPWGS